MDINFYGHISKFKQRAKNYSILIKEVNEKYPKGFLEFCTIEYQSLNNNDCIKITNKKDYKSLLNNFKKFDMEGILKLEL